jgi:hypothetical protein
METLVATVLIIIVFVISSMILNNVFSSSIKNNTLAAETRLDELQYLYLNNKLTIAYSETLNTWEISIERYEFDSHKMIEFEAKSLVTGKSISRNGFEIK